MKILFSILLVALVIRLAPAPVHAEEYTDFRHPLFTIRVPST